MHIHTSQINWRRPGLRRVTRVVVFLGAVALEYGVAHVPVQVDVESTGKFTPATIKRAQEDLIIEGPVVSSPPARLLSHRSGPGEIVDVFFQLARLSNDTISRFQRFGLTPPEDSRPINYVTEDAPPGHGGNGKCMAQISVEPQDVSRLPAEIRFLQLGDAGSDPTPYFAMKDSSSELLVEMLTDSQSNSLPDCGYQKRLKVGQWAQSITTPENLKVVAARDSEIRFYFRPVNSNFSPAAVSGSVVSSFTLGAIPRQGDPPPFQARAVRIDSLQSGRPSVPSILSARSRTGQPLLAVSGFAVGADKIQINVSGKGRVESNGNEVTVNVLDWVKGSPLLERLVELANAGLVAWLLLAFRRKRGGRRTRQE